MNMHFLEEIVLKKSRGLFSRFRILIYKCFGASIASSSRMERGRMRRCKNIVIGQRNAFTEGWYLWPIEESYVGKRIVIGNKNYFNRNLMIDACGYIEIGDFNMFGPDVYITDSNHSFGKDVSPSQAPMIRGKVIIGNHCWIGAKAVILKDVELGDYCVVAAGAVVTRSFPSGSIIGGVPAKLLKHD